MQALSPASTARLGRWEGAHHRLAPSIRTGKAQAGAAGQAQPGRGPSLFFVNCRVQPTAPLIVSIGSDSFLFSGRLFIFRCNRRIKKINRNGADLVPRERRSATNCDRLCTFNLGESGRAVFVPSHDRMCENRNQNYRPLRHLPVQEALNCRWGSFGGS